MREKRAQIIGEKTYNEYLDGQEREALEDEAWKRWGPDEIMPHIMLKTELNDLSR